MESRVVSCRGIEKASLRSKMKILSERSFLCILDISLKEEVYCYYGFTIPLPLHSLYGLHIHAPYYSFSYNCIIKLLEEFVHHEVENKCMKNN